MSTQLAITVDAPDRLWIRTVNHHRDHPELLGQVAAHYRRIRQSCLDAGRDVPTVSMRDVFGALRLDSLRHEPDGDGFALNNSYCAGYGRLLIEHYPDVAGMVATRVRQAEQ